MITWAERAKAAISQKGQNGTAKTDETVVSRLLAVSSVPTLAVSASPERLSSVLTVPTPLALEKHDSSRVLIDDPDRWCWPLNITMTGAEIDAFTARLARFTSKGFSLDDGEALSDKLVMRDRESDDRRLCLECLHLSGHAAGSWGCRNWQQAEVVNNSRDARLPAELVRTLQHCNGFIHQNQTGGQHG
jgi:hypothetical protein